ncbi:ArsR/SmtB family transcription factor [Bradyrhizobium sp.]|uniref:ArsR/SmtB family transcription factor n=1 Tax=Bradyrhizobium sp. TaxID=376 RepID=UPI003C70F602
MRIQATVKSIKRSPAKPALDTDAMLKSARKASDFLKALSHENRLVILCLLIEGDKTVRELEELLDLRQAAVSQQLARLRADNLVEARRNGNSVRYSVARPEVVEIMSALYSAFCR